MGVVISYIIQAIPIVTYYMVTPNHIFYSKNHIYQSDTMTYMTIPKSFASRIIAFILAPLVLTLFVYSYVPKSWHQDANPDQINIVILYVESKNYIGKIIFLITTQPV